MSPLHRLLAASALAVGLFGSSMPANAIVAAQTYYFYGSCADCTLNSAPGDPIATLTLADDYVPDTALDITDLVSFSYVGSDLVGAYTVNQDGFEAHLGYAMSGVMDAAAGPKDFQLEFGDGLRFATSASGSWYTCAPAPDGSPYYSGTCDYLNNSDFARAGAQWNAPGGTTVPEPTSLALLAMGALVACRRRPAV